MSTKSKRELINHIIVDVFNEVLIIQEKNLQTKGITLSLSEVHTLEAIDKAGQQNKMSDIAESLNITLSTLSINIKRLSAKGYVLRKISKNDRRVVHLELTDDAYEVLKIHQSFHDELIDSFFNDLHIDEDEVLLESLQKIDNHLKRLISNLE